jgi:hypothetical protein
MSKNPWYDKKEDAFIRRRALQLELLQQPYGRRTAVYRKIASEMYLLCGVKRPWQGIQQRLILLKTF